MNNPETGRTSWLLAGLLAFMAVAATDSLAADPAAPADTPAGTVEETPLSTLRDPFWPKGFRPTPKVVQSKQTTGGVGSATLRWVEAAKQLKITGTSRTSKGVLVAVVKGVGVVEAGDMISVRYEGIIYRWKVLKITEKGIVTKEANAYFQN